MMWRFLTILLLISGMIACELEDDPVEMDHPNSLLVSTDTLQFDTLVAGRLSITKRFRIYNYTDSRQTISSIALRDGSNSAYRLIINGVNETRFTNTTVNSGDSILVLVDLMPPGESTSALDLIDDEVQISSQAGSGSIVLQAWSLAAEYLPKGFICDTYWGADEAHIVTDTLVVDRECTLTIGAGAKILFDQSAALFIQGTLVVEGTVDDPAVFRYSRLDEYYQMAPGQWDGIYFLEGSSGNRIENAIVENGRVGFRLGTPDNDTIPDVVIRNTTIRHMSQQGILAFSSDLLAENLLIYDVGLHAGFHAIGGSYTYNHVTLTNYPSQVGGEDPVMIFADHLIVDEGTLYEPLLVSLRNSILWGGAVESDLIISLEQPDNASIVVANNIIFSEQSLADNVVSTDLSFPRFVDPFTFNYQLDSLSPAVNNAVGSNLKIDISGFNRDSLPDIGAYEFHPHEKE